MAAKNNKELYYQIIFSLSHIEGIILGAGEVAGGASGMGVVRIGDVGNRASEGHAAGVYGQVLQWST